MKSRLWSQPELLAKFQGTSKGTFTTYDYQSRTGHITSVEDFNIGRREGNNFARTIKESIYMRVNNPILNRNIGKYGIAFYSPSQNTKTRINKNN